MRIARPPRLARVTRVCGVFVAIAAVCALWPTSLRVPRCVVLAGAPLAPARMPMWFGNGESPLRVAGVTYVDDRPAPLTVHLRFSREHQDAWRGLDLVSGTDGRFDLGALPRGEYQIWAGDRHHASRVVEIDTRLEPASSIDLFGYRCKPLDGIVSTEEDIPVLGAHVQYGGADIAISGLDGRFRACILRDDEAVVTMTAVLAGHETGRWWGFQDDVVDLVLYRPDPELRGAKPFHVPPEPRTRLVRGRVLYRGRPVPDASVWYEGSGSMCGWPIYVEHTDRDGHFEMAVEASRYVAFDVIHTPRGLRATYEVSGGPVEIALEAR